MQDLTSQSQLDDQSFQKIADLAYHEVGLTLTQEKAALIRSRLRHRLRALNYRTFGQYSSFVCSDAGKKERGKLISALTTNVSHFFREPHHFERLLRRFMTCDLDRIRKGGTLRIWSAGCSNGQEPLSIAMALLEMAPEIVNLDVRILATDIDAQVIRFCDRGIYDERQLGVLAQNRRDNFFKPTNFEGETYFEAGKQLRKLVRYKEMNLLSEWPMKRNFDVIFCRNVVIYFDPMTQAKLWPRFSKALTSDGLLFLGHSERIADPAQFGIKAVGPTLYSKTRK